MHRSACAANSLAQSGDAAIRIPPRIPEYLVFPHTTMRYWFEISVTPKPRNRMGYPSGLVWARVKTCEFAKPGTSIANAGGNVFRLVAVVWQQTRNGNNPVFGEFDVRMDHGKSSFVDF